MPGSLAITNTFLNASPAAISKLDANFTRIRDYVNNREVVLSTLAARPAAGTSGRLYVATDVAGGTLYEDNGTVWTAIAGGVTAGAGAQAVGLFTPAFFF